ncbi:MAG: hypothetical protein K8U57_22585 [Planctomycetes bacterium]|nr:hypothetical protein [Planctomycetota bacterium]
MTAGRRRILLSAVFLGLASLLTSTPARAQDTSSHKLWQTRPLTPDQVREALARMGAGESGDLDPFQEMVKDYLQKNNPQLDSDQTKEIIKRLTGDKQLMDQLKQFSKQKQTDPGRPGKLNQDDLAKLFNSKQGGKLPELPPDLNLKGFLPKIDPFKVDPKIGPQPPIDPKVEPKVEPNIKPDPVEDPNKVDPEPTLPMPPELGKQNPDKDTVSLDKNPFPEPEDATDARTKSLQAFAALWERNVGPLSETPEVQRALFEAFSENGLDFDMKDDKGNSIWDLLKNSDGSSSNFNDLFNNSGSMGKWDFGKWELPKVGDWFSSRRQSDNTPPSWLNSNPSPPRPSSSSGWGLGSGSGWSGFEAWLPFLILFVIVLGVVLWFQLKNLRAQSSAVAFAGADLGAWPVDPRSINTRQEVVLAFEYLSVLICGPSARNWTHSTIAAALADLATTHEETAMMLARLYELARYAPLDEPLTSPELIETRKLVCSLAGVSY